MKGCHDEPRKFKRNASKPRKPTKYFFRKTCSLQRKLQKFVISIWIPNHFISLKKTFSKIIKFQFQNRLENSIFVFKFFARVFKGEKIKLKRQVANEVSRKSNFLLIGEIVSAKRLNYSSKAVFPLSTVKIFPDNWVCH
jgi:hypothetical protein